MKMSSGSASASFTWPSHLLLCRRRDDDTASQPTRPMMRAPVTTKASTVPPSPPSPVLPFLSESSTGFHSRARGNELDFGDSFLLLIPSFGSEEKNGIYAVKGNFYVSPVVGIAVLCMVARGFDSAEKYGEFESAHVFTRGKKLLVFFWSRGISTTPGSQKLIFPALSFLPRTVFFVEASDNEGRIACCCPEEVLEHGWGRNSRRHRASHIPRRSP